MHYPIGFHTFWCSAFVENQSFLDPNLANSTHSCINWLVCSCSFPVPRSCSSIWPCTIGIFPVSWTEKIPLSFSENCFPCCNIAYYGQFTQTKTIPPYTNKAKLEVNSDKKKKEKSEIKTYKEPILRFVLTPNPKIKVISKSQIFKYAKLRQSSKSISLDLIFGLSIPQNHHRTHQFLLQRSTDYRSKPTRKERSEITSF